MFSFAFTDLLLISTVCPAGVLGWYRSPAKGPTPSSTLYHLFFPTLSDTASQVACYSLYSFISMFSNPSDLSSLVIFFCPVLHLLDLLCHSGSLTSIPCSSTIVTACLPQLPEEGLIFDTFYFQPIVHGNLHPHRFHVECVPNRSIIWCRTETKPEQMYIDIRCDLRDYNCSLLCMDHPPLQEITKLVWGNREAPQLGEGWFCLGICLPFWGVSPLAENKVLNPQSFAT